MAEIILVTGGCRSGKSDYAQRLAESISASRLYVATSPVTDEEMRRRIELHRQSRRGRGWETVEEEIDLTGVFRRHAEYDTVLVDCITLWVNNAMYRAEQEGREISETEIAEKCREMLDAVESRSGSVIFVTNEVGMGIVPENAMARHYRDLIGRANRVIADRAATVTLLVSGIPLTLKETKSR
jgi:adenosylcobinamide kinase/adenosylcobinamide-phosphate guanylyltransferase